MASVGLAHPIHAPRQYRLSLVLSAPSQHWLSLVLSAPSQPRALLDLTILQVQPFVLSRQLMVLLRQTTHQRLHSLQITSKAPQLLLQVLIVCSSAGRVPEGTQLLLDCLQSGDQTGLPRLPLLALFVERTVAFQLSPLQQVLSRRTVPPLFFSESSPLFCELLLNLPQAPLVVCPQSLDLEGCLGLSAVAIRPLPQSSRLQLLRSGLCALGSFRCVFRRSRSFRQSPLQFTLSIRQLRYFPLRPLQLLQSPAHLRILLPQMPVLHLQAVDLPLQTVHSRPQRLHRSQLGSVEVVTRAAIPGLAPKM